MRIRNYPFIALLFFACLLELGCALSRDISDDPKYQPWIGKTVRVVGPKELLNVFEHRDGSYFLSYYDGIDGDTPIAKLPIGYPAVVEAVKLVDCGTIMGPATRIEVILSMEHPTQKNKRIRVACGSDYVEPFQTFRWSSRKRDSAQEDASRVGVPPGESKADLPGK